MSKRSDSTTSFGTAERIRRRRRRTTMLVGSLVFAAVVIYIGRSIYIAQRGERAGARHYGSRNDLHQIGVALHNYHDVYGALPPLYTVDAQGKPLHSWRTLILPFVEQRELYQRIDRNEAWNDPANVPLGESTPDVYEYRYADYPSGHTPYLAIVAPDGCLRPEKSVSLSDVTDDLGLTMMIVEAPPEYAVPWMAPTDVDETRFSEMLATRDPEEFVSFHVVMMNGSVLKFYELTATQLRAFISIKGNDDLIAEEAAR